MKETDGDTITWYNLWDGTGGNNFSVDGISIDATSGKWIEASSLSSASLVSDGSASSQTLYIQSYDGSVVSSWDSFILETVVI